MTVTRVTTNAEGEGVAEQMINTTGGVSRSTDYDAGGTTVRNQGVGSRTVTKGAQIADDELVTIEDMEITGKMARSLGLLNATFDESLSAGAAASAAATDAENAGSQDEQGTGNEQFDATVENLNAKIDDGSMQIEEAREYETAASQLAFAEISVPDVMEAIGTGDTSGLDAEARTVVDRVEAAVTEAATKSAKAELGPDGYGQLTQLAAASPVVFDALRNFAAQRAQGKAAHSWSEFLEGAIDEMSGITE